MADEERKKKRCANTEQAEVVDGAPARKKMRGEGNALEDSSYLFRDGLRCIRPYYFTFTTHAKGRWVGSTIHDVFTREFQSESAKYYEKAIHAGKVTINSQMVQVSTVVNHNDLICHRVHRHEPPVAAHPISILHEDDQLVVVNKPSSIPVHPCGRYRHNTVVFILNKEHGLSNLHTIHRLDRLTSGLLMFAKSLVTAQRLEQQIRERLVTKQYLCRVLGEFPENPVVCSEPIAVVSHKLGVCRVDPSGKPSSTLFTRLSFNGSSSLLQCEPRTGRMHQIRVHLQWLGFPVLGDPLYNHPAWGPHRGHQGEGRGDIDEVVAEIVKTNYSLATEETHSSEQVISEQQLAKDKQPLPEQPSSGQHQRKCGGGACEGAVDGDRDPVCTGNRDPDSAGDKDPVCTEDSDPVCTEDRDPDCTECALSRPDPAPHQLLMYLHALSYSGPDWQYSTPRPWWAADDWKEP